MHTHKENLAPYGSSPGAANCSVCQVEGCNLPVYDKKSKVCFKHNVECLARLFEDESVGDTLKDISDGKQMAKWLRDLAGI